MSHKSEIIGKVLSPALCLWLRSQVDSVEELQLQIFGRDRQILRGYIPDVSLSSTYTVYQGLHLRQVQLTAENIRINIGQILKGKPFRLLEPIRVAGELQLEEADLNASVSSSLLSNAFTDLLLTLLESSGISQPNTILEKYRVNWQKVILNADKFTLCGTLTDKKGHLEPIRIDAGLELINPQVLRLYPIQIECLPQLLPIAITHLQIDLGSDVEIEKLSLATGKLSCCGRGMVRSS
jgi:LmeA-like phospholipid-binding